MAHKVHPKAFRIKETSNWNSRWMTKKKFSKELEEDFKIREFLKKKLKDCGVEKIEIEKSPGKIIVIINTARPGLIIGRGGAGAEELKEALQKFLVGKKEMKIEVREIKELWSKANLASQWIASQIERRVPHRRVLKQALDKIVAQKGVQGARVEVAGRLGGTEISRREWLKRGRLPRQTLRAEIDFAENRAFCTYGTIGIKVWIYKGEKFEE